MIDPKRNTINEKKSPIKDAIDKLTKEYIIPEEARNYGGFNYKEYLKYNEVKAKLELLGINVLVEKKDIENKDDYKNKEELINYELTSAKNIFLKKQ